MREATHEDIMKKAKAKYDLLVNSRKWGAKFPDQEKIIALEAKVKELKDLKLSAQLLCKLKEDDQDQKEEENDGQNETREHSQKTRSNKQLQRQDEEWKKVPPKENEPKHKKVGKKTFHWCIYHKKWTVHKAEDCTLGKEQGDAQDKQSDQQITANQAAYARLLAQLALQAADE